MTQFTLYAAHLNSGIRSCSDLPTEHTKGNKAVRSWSGDFDSVLSAQKELLKKARNSRMRFTWSNHLSLLQ